VHIISRKALRDAAQIHGSDLGAALDVWYRVALKATWKSIVDVRKIFPSADGVGVYTVFNIKGNSYRLITVIRYPKTLFIRDVLTHAEYGKGRWNE
jgi:mRNA interferase HigB